MNHVTSKITVRNTIISSDHPCICTPLIGKNDEELLSEIENIKSSGNMPDLVEWRIDFFQEIKNKNSVLSTLKLIHEELAGIPLLFTLRAEEEGGEKVGLSHLEKVDLLENVVKSKLIDILDVESFHEHQYIQRLREATKNNDVKLILSYHNFEKTPPLSFMLKKLLEAEFYGADIAKLAVMPLNKKDVLTLLTATEEANNLMKIPLITMSMGNYGSLSRMFGWVFGSTVSFGVRENSSAPGQIPLDDLKSVMELTKELIGTNQKL